SPLLHTFAWTVHPPPHTFENCFFSAAASSPQQELPPFYRPWMEIANNLPSLIESHQLRAQVDKVPNSHHVSLARLILSFITMGYVWQEGETGIAKVLPRNLAIPYGEISRVLGLPPILVHADLILVNWKKRNPFGCECLPRNLEPIVCLPGGSSTRGFILVTFLVEKAAVPGIKVTSAPDRRVSFVLDAVEGIYTDLHQHLGRRNCPGNLSLPLLSSSWKDNPSLPEGLIYEGFCDQPLAYSGGSAAQSTTLHAFDELLGVQHLTLLCVCAAAFLHSMRDYMPRPHRAFIEELRRAPPLRRHVSRSGSERLRLAYNKCVAALSDLRTYHIAMVTKYVIIAGRNAKDKPALSSINPLSCLEGRGTGGSGLLSFLKSVRDATEEATLPS
uniref:Indoleamine 2,3-dioxygenase 2 n=1 Tax=Varanus komodoensis TaxID=61221 RepID=A0A8D2LJE8_VARKO